jgi:hypothetical protein
MSPRPAVYVVDLAYRLRKICPIPVTAAAEDISCHVVEVEKVF